MQIKSYSIYTYQRNTISQLREIFDDIADWDDISENTDNSPYASESITYIYGNAVLTFGYTTGNTMYHSIATGSVKQEISPADTYPYIGIIICKTASSLAVMIEKTQDPNGIPRSELRTSTQLRFVLTRHHNVITGAEEKGIVNLKYASGVNTVSYNVSSAGDPNIYYESYSLNTGAVKTVLCSATTKNSYCYCPHVFIPRYSNVVESNAIVKLNGRTYYMIAGGLYILDD
ncbi:MAG: hypothetical protein K2I00_02195 [Ruminococcus sp.]|nr:hypothetical protein [Ruminococcus sp.]